MVLVWLEAIKEHIWLSTAGEVSICGRLFMLTFMEAEEVKLLMWKMDDFRFVNWKFQAMYWSIKNILEKKIGLKKICT